MNIYLASMMKFESRRWSYSESIWWRTEGTAYRHAFPVESRNICMCPKGHRSVRQSVRLPINRGHDDVLRHRAPWFHQRMPPPSAIYVLGRGRGDAVLVLTPADTSKSSWRSPRRTLGRLDHTAGTPIRPRLTRGVLAQCIDFSTDWYGRHLTPWRPSTIYRTYTVFEPPCRHEDAFRLPLYRFGARWWRYYEQTDDVDERLMLTLLQRLQGHRLYTGRLAIYCGMQIGHHPEIASAGLSVDRVTYLTVDWSTVNLTCPRDRPSNWHRSVHTRRPTTVRFRAMQQYGSISCDHVGNCGMRSC